MQWRGMRTLCCGFVLVTSLAGAVPTIGLSRRHGGRRLTDEARVYGDLTTLMAFHVDVLVGTPGQLQSVIVDTGSARTAFPCTTCASCGEHMDPPFNPNSSKTFRWIPCGEKGCDQCTEDQCSYHVNYVEGSAIKGQFFEDVLQLGLSKYAGKGPVWMGCHSSETKLFRKQAPTGIMGLNEGGMNVVQALAEGPVTHDLFALCLSESGGSMTLGGVNETWMPRTEPFQWASYKSSFFLDLNGISFNGQRLSSGPEVKMQLDSGTTFSYFPRAQTIKMEEAVRAAAKARRVTWSSPSCFQASDDELDQFPNMTFHFGNATYSWPARGYMFYRGDGTWCYSFFQSPPYLLGASFMLNHAVIFDREQKKIGFASSSCPRFVSRQDEAFGLELLPSLATELSWATFRRLGLISLLFCASF